MKKELENLQWLLEKEDSQKKKDHQSYIPFYGDVTELNTERTILDLVGKDTLEMLCTDTMDLLDTSVAVYEKNGDYAYGLFYSGWCQLMDAASRKLCNTNDNKEALSCGKWLCHENCWHDSAKQAIKIGKPTDIDCIGGIKLYAEPIYANNQVIGTINIGYGNPPTDEKTLKELSQKYRIDYNTLLARAKEYKPRPPFIIDIAKKRLHNIALLIGKIVESAQKGKQLIESGEKYQTVFENTGTATILVKEDKTISLVNNQFEKLSGYSKEEVENKMKWSDLVVLEDLEKMEKYHQSRRQNGEASPNEYEFRGRDKRGNIKSIFMKIDLIPGTSQSIASMMDITHLKQTEEKLQKSESILKQTELITKAGGWEYDVRKRKVSWTNGVYRLYGVDRENYDSNNIKQDVSFYTPEDGKKVEKAFWQTVKNGKPYDLEVQFISAKGEQRWVITSGRPVFKDGKVVKVIGNIMDITDRKRSEQRIKHLNRILRAVRNINKLIIRESNYEVLIKKACEILVQNRGYSSVWIVLVDKKGNYFSSAQAGCGPGFTSLMEDLRKGILPKHIKRALQQKRVVITRNPADACETYPLLNNHRGHGVYTISLRHKGILYGLFSVCIPSFYVENKAEQGLFKEVAADISFALYGIKVEEKRKQAAELLEKSERQLQTLMSNLPGIAYRCLNELKWHMLFVNEECFEITGYSAEELISGEGIEYGDIIHPDDRELVYSQIQLAIKENAPFQLEYRIITKSGQKKWVWEKGRAVGQILNGKEILEGLINDITELKESQEKLKKTLDATIDTISKIAETRDPYTAGHQYRVHQLSVAIASELQFPWEKIEAVRIAALIHDIGKMSIPSEILTKPGKLSQIEFDLIREHPQTGYEILKDIDFPYPIAQIVFQHHERINGSGYPNKLKTDQISLEARIIGIADVVEAMSSHRPYRAALGIDVALEEITKNKGILYEPEVVDVCIKLFREKGFEFE